MSTCPYLRNSSGSLRTGFCPSKQKKCAGFFSLAKGQSPHRERCSAADRWRCRKEAEVSPVELLETPEMLYDGNARCQQHSVGRPRRIVHIIDVGAIDPG